MQMRTTASWPHRAAGTGCPRCLLGKGMPHVHRAPRIGLIALSARGEAIDKLGGFRLGADDYVVKPVGCRRRLARFLSTR